MVAESPLHTANVSASFSRDLVSPKSQTKDLVVAKESLIENDSALVQSPPAANDLTIAEDCTAPNESPLPKELPMAKVSPATKISPIAQIPLVSKFSSVASPMATVTPVVEDFPLAKESAAEPTEPIPNAKRNLVDEFRFSFFNSQNSGNDFGSGVSDGVSGVAKSAQQMAASTFGFSIGDALRMIGQNKEPITEEQQVANGIETSISYESAYSNRSYLTTMTRESQTKLEHVLTAQELNIALFGASGALGNHFIRKALLAGYNIKVLSSTPRSITEEESESLTIIEGSLKDKDKVEEVVESADYVLYLADDTLQKSYVPGTTYAFIQMLLPVLKKYGDTVMAFIHVATHLSSAPNEVKKRTPIKLKAIKTYYRAKRKGFGHIVAESDQVSNHIVNNISSDIDFLVLRPPIAKDLESIEKLSIVEKAPLRKTIAHIDLAEFALQAMKNESIYGTFPYVG
mmetsp:Transcript_1021/g.2193  ORF Transcript_1021/g.2193 Transcript_1021/m.2193 type:complete len:459 (-) Transcript_1021:208-1584(-)|eukprot:CAMPEP_0194331566 /NCGR_PEP_ID=MMETSP0171-20130528/55993_1 /TAXON_ID=218684 /ORGANISM="Corethron pennatum, Strain L29A3" /LENGTH=458 /DNA_ID=CAMNT_0039093087 /DNA_START=136 /DNA_END=1512 /DNA_ORIENTATION=-